MSSVLWLILAGGSGKRLSVLTEERAKPAVPIGGKYRVIDIVLSNLANSHLEHIAVLAQFQHQSITEHIGDGTLWAKEGIPIWLPGVERTGLEAYRGTADAVYQNRKWIAAAGCDTVLIVAGDHVYQQDFRDMIRFHEERGGPLTIAMIEVPPAEAGRFGMMQTDADQKIVGFVEKPGQSDWGLASMGIYVFNTGYLLEMLDAESHAEGSGFDFGMNINPKVVAAGKAYAYPFHGRWADISGVKDYWEANLALLGEHPLVNLGDPAWTLIPREQARPPVQVRPGGRVMNSLVSEGCVIEGEVAESVLSPGVRVESGAVVRRSVILRDTLVRSGAVVDECVIDEWVDVGRNAQIGSGDARTVNQAEPEILSAGITVIGMHARIPAGAVLGRNVKVAPHVTPEDFERLEVPAGSSVESKIK